MFSELENFVPVGTPDTAVIVPAVQPPAPPTRFGATRIVLPQDPPRAAITIHERPNDANHSDYIVFITQQIRCEGTYYAELITLLRSLTAASKVEIYIGSPGGSLHTGAMIANAIRASKAAVTTIAIGVVASAAALIWSYGQRRVVMEGAVLMFHMSSHSAWDNSKAIAIQAENTVRYVKEIAIDPLVAQGLLTPDEAETIIDRRRELWLDSVTLNTRLEAIHAKAA
jgi:ATP-dependent protease ClpP protease subunit